MSTRAERVTIVVVDDRLEHWRDLERGLGDHYEVLTADNRSSALDLIDDQVEVVLLDRGISDTNGDTLLATIRERGYECRIVVVTENEPDDDIIDRGFDASLEKPLTTTALKQTIERLLARSSYEEQLQELYTLCVQRAKARADGGPLLDQDGRGPAGTEDREIDALEERIRELRKNVDETVESFETTDYRASFRDILDIE